MDLLIYFFITTVGLAGAVVILAVLQKLFQEASPRERSSAGSRTKLPLSPSGLIRQDQSQIEAGSNNGAGHLNDFQHWRFRDALPKLVESIYFFFNPEKLHRRNALRKIRSMVSKHERTLVMKRNQLVQSDDYGRVDGSKWVAEINYFFQNIVEPQLSDAEKATIVKELNRIGTEEIESRIRETALRLESSSSFTDAMNGIDYEHFVGDLLRKAGWSVKVSQASGDQGADVVAEKEGLKVVVQCKMYSSPVGNKAVQEVYAAKQFYLADQAWVVIPPDLSGMRK